VSPSATFTFAVPYYLARSEPFSRTLERRVAEEVSRRGYDPDVWRYSYGIAGCQVTVTIQEASDAAAQV